MLILVLFQTKLNSAISDGSLWGKTFYFIFIVSKEMRKKQQQKALSKISFLCYNFYFLSHVHRHLRIVDCLTARVFFISTVNDCSKKTEEKTITVNDCSKKTEEKTIMSCASGGHINKT
jgi:hypothetical protein